jgi:predicted Rossmann-fold nucleotide-binding protein
VSLRVLVCGGRHYADKSRVWDALDALADEQSAAGGGLFVIEGGAQGADRFAREWRAKRLHPGKTYPAAWDREGKAAGVLRNGRMLAEGKPDLVLAFPGGRGTMDMVLRAEAAGVPVQRPR